MILQNSDLFDGGNHPDDSDLVDDGISPRTHPILK